jgi:hypothetical protein
VCVEATLKNEYKKLYTGYVTPKDKAGVITMKEEVSGSNDAYSGMINNVEAVVRK